MSKIKILIVLEATLGGTRKHVIDLLSNINLNLFEITFCYSTRRADINFFNDIEVIKYRGIRCVEISMTREISIIKDIKSFLDIYLLIKKGQFNIVHAHSSKAGFLGRITAKLASKNIKTIYTPHSLPINLNKFYKYLEKMAVPFTDKIIAVSDSEKKEIIASKLTSKIEKINSGVNIFQTKSSNKIIHKEFNFDEKSLIVISVGRLTKQKDPLTFFYAANEYLIKYKQNFVYFIWVGDGELRPEVSNFINNNGLKDFCKILGWCTNVDELLWCADIFVLTSVYESFGYVTCEAMSHFLPIIATKVVGTTDIVINNESGFLTEIGDYKAISNYIYSLVDDPQLRKNMGDYGNKQIKENFNVNNMVKKTEELYSSIMKNS